MPTPVKAITYLDGTFDEGPVMVKPRPLALAPMDAQVLRQAPAMWRPVRYAAAQDRAEGAVKVRPISLVGFIGAILTPFWRSGNQMGKGQQHP